MGSRESAQGFKKGGSQSKSKRREKTSSSSLSSASSFFGKKLCTTVSSSFSLSFSSSSSFAFFTPRQKKPLFKQPWPTGRRPSTSPSSPSRSVSSRPGKRARVRGGGGRAAGRRETKAKMDSKTRRPKADDDGGERGRVALVLLDEGARFLAAALSDERVRSSALHTIASSASESARPRSQMSEEGRYRRERASAKVVAKKRKKQPSSQATHLPLLLSCCFCFLLL